MVNLAKKPFEILAPLSDRLTTDVTLFLENKSNENVQFFLQRCGPDRFRHPLLTEDHVYTKKNKTNREYICACGPELPCSPAPCHNIPDHGWSSWPVEGGMARERRLLSSQRATIPNLKPSQCSSENRAKRFG